MENPAKTSRQPVKPDPDSRKTTASREIRLARFPPVGPRPPPLTTRIGMRFATGWWREASFPKSFYDLRCGPHDVGEDREVSDSLNMRP